MVGGDSLAAATRASKIFRDPRVYQFYDENRLCGLAYAEQVFPHAYDEADRSLPTDHWLREHLAGIRERPREQKAFWDVVFFYAPGPEWTDRPPTPTHWLKQTAFFPSSFSHSSYLLTDHLNFRSASRRRPTGLFWKDSFAEPPFESDWFAAIREVMNIACPRE